MPRTYNGVKRPNRLGEPCIRCKTKKSVRWSGIGPYACTISACRAMLADAVAAAAASASFATTGSGAADATVAPDGEATTDAMEAACEMELTELLQALGMDGDGESSPSASTAAQQSRQEPADESFVLARIDANNAIAEVETAELRAQVVELRARLEAEERARKELEKKYSMLRKAYNKVVVEQAQGRQHDAARKVDKENAMPAVRVGESGGVVVSQYAVSG